MAVDADDTAGDDTPQGGNGVQPEPSPQTVDPPAPMTEPASSPVPEPVVTAGPMCEFGSPGEFCLTRQQMEQQGATGFGQIAMDPPRSPAEVAAAFDDNGCIRFDWVGDGCCNPGQAPGTPQGNGDCCYIACQGACCGRPYVVEGVAVTASTVRRSDWGVASSTPSLAPESARLLAEAWLQDAAMEHASIASFARFTLDLMALGAPPALLRDAQRASLDEIEHAALCFGIARGLSGEAVGPGPLAVGGFSPRSLFDTLRAAVHEGCVGETLAAGIVQEQARRATEPELARVLERIAADELRHAELAYRFVAWAIAQYGDEARRVVQEAFASALAHAPEPPPALPLETAESHAAGRLTAAEWEHAAERLLRDVVRPAAEALGRLPRAEIHDAASVVS